jgi:hypothetical protein
VDALTPRTALERLKLLNVAGSSDEYLPESACAFSMLRQLTALDLGGSVYSVTDMGLHQFAACTGLRRLRLNSASSSSSMLHSESAFAAFLETLNVTLRLLMETWWRTFYSLLQTYVWMRI